MGTRTCTGLVILFLSLATFLAVISYSVNHWGQLNFYSATFGLWKICDQPVRLPYRIECRWIHESRERRDQYARQNYNAEYRGISGANNRNSYGSNRYSNRYNDNRYYDNKYGRMPYQTREYPDWFLACEVLFTISMLSLVVCLILLPFYSCLCSKEGRCFVCLGRTIFTLLAIALLVKGVALLVFALSVHTGDRDDIKGNTIVGLGWGFYLMVGSWVMTALSVAVTVITHRRALD
ncbi:PREDICTED: uncharacterized protein LOC106810338 [Priapulus caudatus]|uniref:Uncharacterized protein LOC106810338 n=1 Tax=Priapulus caudatus TaxID=37621 RepID=A0ABM1EAB4_PRICU|nr:PREDICTED: uncharacterized protein LOC106810338 [Priapulus caudatus]XP_014669135.1 PREDICTED: uncharacterized protein LOC106810338 [Priapulus caudatus]XP_014669136.1 PREDICTED: uncharacterized protein LOC106810338 [Priapulus caudatus]